VSIRTFGSFIWLSGCGGSVPTLPEGAEKSDTLPVLKEAYSKGFLVGSAINEDIASKIDSTSYQIVKQQMNTITAENVLKAGPLCPEPGVYDFSAADEFVKMGENLGMFIVGHTLVWHNQTPSWFFTDHKGEANTPEKQIQQMHDHIKMVAQRYAGRIHAWDVVNEIDCR